MRRAVLAAALLLFSTAAAAQVTPSHPLSHIYPIDTDFNMSDRTVYNLSSVELRNGLNLNGNEIRSDAGAPLLRYDSGVNEWKLTEDINVTSSGGSSYEIRNFFASACPSGQVVQQVNSDGSYSCTPVDDEATPEDLNTTLEAGNLANQSIVLDGENLEEVGNITEIGEIQNYYQQNCASDETVQQVYPNGTYNCTDPTTLTTTEDLAQTLSEGNFAGGSAIYMNGSGLFEIGSGATNLTSAGGVQAGDNVSLSGNSIESLNRLYQDGSGTNFFDSCSGSGEYIYSIDSNGSVTCATDDSETGAESLNATLETGNLANQSIYMEENDLIDIGNITGSGIVNRPEISSQAVSSSELASSVAGTGLSGGAGSALSVIYGSSSGTAAQGNVTVDVTAGTALAGGGSLTVGDDSSSVTLGVAQEGITNALIAYDAVNQSQLAKGNCGTDEVLRWDGSSWVCVDGSNVGTDSQDLQYSAPAVDPASGSEPQEIGITNGTNITFQDYFNPNQSLSVQNDTGPTANEITISGGNTVPIDDDVVDADADPENEYQNLQGVLSNGTSAGPYNVDLSGSNITQLFELRNYYDQNCQSDELVQRVYPNGTYNCIDPSTLSSTEDLQQTLSEGNFAGSNSIVMNGSAITQIGSGGTNITSSGRIEAGADVDLNTGGVENLNNLYSDGGSTSFFSGGATESETVTGIASGGSLQTTSILAQASNLAPDSVNQTHIVDSEVTSSELNTGVAGTGLSGGGGSSLEVDYGSSSGTAAQGNVTVDVSAGTALSGGGSLTVGDDSSSVSLGVAQEGITNTLVAYDAVNQSQLAQGNCGNDDLLVWDGSSWSCQENTTIGTDSQDLQYSLSSDPTGTTNGQEIGITGGANITFQDSYNPNQTLSVENDTGPAANEITLSGGNTVPIEDDFQDGDTDSTNEYQSLSEVLDNGTGAGSFNISMNSNSVENLANLYSDTSGTSFFGTGCAADQLVEGVNSDGSYDCRDPDTTVTDEWVNETGDNMTGELNMSFNPVTAAGSGGVQIGDGAGDVDLNGEQVYDGELAQFQGLGVTDSLSTAQSEVSGYSVYVQDNIDVDGDIVGSGGDVAEHVKTAEEQEPGTVVSITGEMQVNRTEERYDTAVAGVVSTDPGVRLKEERGGVPLALSGIVPTKVTVSNGEIEPGDLLTTAGDGMAMKCENRYRCEGAIVGKAMEPADEDGKIEVLVTLA